VRFGAASAAINHATLGTLGKNCMNSLASFALTPLSAGDIIDQAIRLYRRNFLALLRIVIAPSLVAYAGSVFYYTGVRNFSLSRGDERVAFTVLLIVSGVVLWIAGKAAFYLALGGAARVLVEHFFEGRPLLARDVYRALRRRFWALVGALIMISILLLGLLLLTYFVVTIVVLLYVSLTAALINSLPYWMQLIIHVIAGIAFTVGVVSLLLLIYSRVVYVPQVMMVEDKGVFAAISRSFTLASGETRRVGAVLLFWIYVAWSVWLLLYAPLGWYGYWHGVDLTPFNQDVPLWFNVMRQALSQVSEILLAPIAMLGFTLLYLDSRVRKEGYDVELLANRVLAAPPPIPLPQPVAFTPAPDAAASFPSILGINNPAPAPETATTGHSSFDPAETERITQGTSGADFAASTAPARQSETPPVERIVAPPLADEPASTQTPRSAPPIIGATRTCRYCNTAADAEDRFCRVCGSVF
jgi:hypothetical protein